MKTLKRICKAIAFPFVTLSILWNESKYLVFGNEKEGGERDV